MKADDKKAKRALFENKNMMKFLSAKVKGAVNKAIHS
jgi:hypothetical protein